MKNKCWVEAPLCTEDSVITIVIKNYNGTHNLNTTYCITHMQQMYNIFIEGNYTILDIFPEELGNLLKIHGT